MSASNRAALIPPTKPTFAKVAGYTLGWGLFGYVSGTAGLALLSAFFAAFALFAFMFIAWLTGVQLPNVEVWDWVSAHRSLFYIVFRITGALGAIGGCIGGYYVARGPYRASIK